MICEQCMDRPAQNGGAICSCCTRELAAQFTDLLHGPAIILNPSDIVRLEAQQQGYIASEQESPMERDRR